MSMAGAMCRRGLLLGAGLWFFAGVGACRVEFGAPTQTLAACPDAVPSGRVVLYTSVYREVVDALQELAHTELPHVDVQVFQGGSEKVAARLDADLAAGRAGADVLLISDPLVYRRLKTAGELLPYASAAATPIPRALVDYDNAFVGARVSTMVIAWNPLKTESDTVPRTLGTILSPAHARDLAFGDPLSSGTFFMTSLTVAAQAAPDSWPPPFTFLRTLREGGAAIGGGNGVVLDRLLRGERRFGVVLLENVLAAQARNEPIAWRIPDDGPVVVAGDVAILADTKNPVAARALVDLLLAPAGQRIIVDVGRMHAVDPRLPAPDAAPPLNGLLAARPLDEALLARAAATRSDVTDAIQDALVGP